MPSSFFLRSLVAFTLLGLGALAACQEQEPPSSRPAPPTDGPAPDADALPPPDADADALPSPGADGDGGWTPPDDELDSGGCPRGYVPGYDQPGCGDKAKLGCIAAYPDAAAAEYCNCQNMTVRDRVQGRFEPFQHLGACPGDGGVF